MMRHYCSPYQMVCTPEKHNTTYVMGIAEGMAARGLEVRDLKVAVVLALQEMGREVQAQEGLDMVEMDKGGWVLLEAVLQVQGMRNAYGYEPATLLKVKVEGNI